MNRIDLFKFVSNKKSRHRILNKLSVSKDENTNLYLRFLNRFASAIDQYESFKSNIYADLSVLIRQYINFFSGGTERLPKIFCEENANRFINSSLEYIISDDDKEYGLVRSHP